MTPFKKLAPSTPSRLRCAVVAMVVAAGAVAGAGPVLAADIDADEGLPSWAIAAADDVGGGMGGGMTGPRHQHQGMMGHGMMGHGMMGQGMMGRMGGAAMMLGPGLDRMLDRLKATPEQRAEIRKLAGAARDDLRAHRQQLRDLRQAGIALWTQPALDGASIESHRQKVMTHHDQGSRRMTQAMLDIGRVLTAEQRRELGTWMKHRAEGHRHHGPMPGANPGMPGMPGGQALPPGRG